MTFIMTRQILVEMAQSFGVQPRRATPAATGWTILPSCSFSAALSKPGLLGAPPKRKNCLRHCGQLTNRCSTGSPPTWCCRYREEHNDAARDHWARGPRGTLARRLIEELSEPMPTHGTERQAAGKESRWRRLRSRLDLGRKE